RAAEDFKKGTALSPHYPHGFVLWGLAHEKDGNPEKARAAFLTAVDTEPSDPVTHYNLARFLESGGELNHARLEYHRAAALKPRGETLDLVRQGLYRLGEPVTPDEKTVPSGGGNRRKRKPRAEAVTEGSGAPPSAYVPPFRVPTEEPVPWTASSGWKGLW
ncbi:MAG: hypothetical protein V2B18_23215, partial [Pseudomonadota bacterium]